MRALSDTLLAAQRKPDKLSYVEAKVYDYEQGIQRLQWVRLYEGLEPGNHHGIAFDGQGSMHRIRVEGNNLYRQKIVDPDEGSDYSNWQLGSDNCAGPCAIAACGAKVYIFYRSSSNVLRKYYSHDYGLSWSGDSFVDYTDVLCMAAAWWGASDIVVCFAAKVNEINAVALNTDSQELSQYPKSEPLNHPLQGIYGIGATYEPDHMDIIFAAEQEAERYNFYAIYRSQLSNTYSWLGWDYFLQHPDRDEDPPISCVYPDIHYPISPSEHEAVLITVVEKFSGTTAFSRPLLCHLAKGTVFSDATFTEPKPFINISSSYGLRLATTGSYWYMERPDGVWRASRAVGEPLDITPDILCLRSVIASGAKQSLAITVDNSKGQYGTPPDKGNEVVLKLGYKTSQGNEAVEAGHYWIDGWEWTSCRGQSALQLSCRDFWGLAQDWIARYTMRWNYTNTSPHSVWMLLQKLLAKFGICLWNNPEVPKSDTMDNFYPLFYIRGGSQGHTELRNLLALVSDVLIQRGEVVFSKDLRSDEGSCYEYSSDTVIKGKYCEALLTTHTQVSGKTSGEPSIDVMEEAFDWDELERGIDNLALKYDANLEEADLAQKRAEALLRKSAMESVGGQIIVPLNCGQELYDVITVSDGRCGISNRKYRVVGIESRYDCLQNIYQQKLMLGAL